MLFSSADYLINSHNLFSWLCIDIIKRKLLFVNLGDKMEKVNTLVCTNVKGLLRVQVLSNSPHPLERLPHKLGEPWVDLDGSKPLSPIIFVSNWVKIVNEFQV